MLEEHKRDYSIVYGDLLIQVDYYYPGTNYMITSASLEPNDSEEIEYAVYKLNEDGDIIGNVYDDDGVYDSEEIQDAIRRVEKGDY